MPASKTIAAASGSAQMLNSAEAVVLPSRDEPPMSEIARDPLAEPGCAAEQGDVGQRPGRDERHRLARRRAAAPTSARRAVTSTGPNAGSGRSAPSRPAAPWNSTGDPRLADERAIGAGRHRDVGPAEQGQDAQGVAGRPIERRRCPRPS